MTFIGENGRRIFNIDLGPNSAGFVPEKVRNGKGMKQPRRKRACD